jgi:hypothetical protein
MPQWPRGVGNKRIDFKRTSEWVSRGVGRPNLTDQKRDLRFNE